MNTVTDFIKKLIIIYTDKGISGLSAQLSYYMLFTFFPILLFANGVLGRILPYGYRLPLSSVIPRQIRDFAESYIYEIEKGANSRLMLLGALLTLWSLTRYIRYYRRSLTRIYEKRRQISFLYDWAISLVFSIGMLLLFYLAVFSVFVTDSVLVKLGFYSFAGSVWYMLRFIIIALFAFLVICLVSFTECGSGKRLWDFAPGSLCSVGVWTVVSVIFSYYARSIADYSAFYGSIGNVIMLLVWLNLTNTILLMGGVVNICLNNNT